MKTKVVFKKGRYVRTRTGKEVIKIARAVYNGLRPLTYKQEIVGSIRRKSPNPVDADIVVIPKSQKSKISEGLENSKNFQSNKQKIINHLNKKGKYLQGGDKRVSFKIKGVKVEIYFAAKKSWGAHLLTYTGPFQYNIGLRMVAKRKGYLLNQYGLFIKKSNKYIVGKTEESIYKALDKKWKEPELRGK